MNFRLAVVGHRSSVDEIRQIVAEKFDNVETVGVELANDEMVSGAVKELERRLPQLDGILYTRREPYELIVSRMDHASIPARYVDVDAPSFVQGLLIAALKYNADIRRVSVDTLDYSTIMRTYESLEIPAENVHPVVVRVDINARHFVEATVQAHCESYRNGLCNVCITNIRDVQDTLEAEGIPCVLMTPSQENYINEIRRLILKWQEREKEKANTAVIFIRAEQNSDYYLQRKNMVQSVLEMGKLAEGIVMFAQRVSGAFVRSGEHDFVIVCDWDVLAEVTDNFTHLDILGQVYSSTPFSLAVGIGTGENLQHALSNAELGSLRARTEGWNRAYLVHSTGEVIGPIQPNELLRAPMVQYDHQLSKVAQDCALSINTITKIDTFARQKNNGSFITAELGQELHVSFRTAARIVEKLEKHGYIVEIGRSAINDRGRPTRIFRLLW